MHLRGKNEGREAVDNLKPQKAECKEWGLINARTLRGKKIRQERSQGCEKVL